MDDSSKSSSNSSVDEEIYSSKHMNKPARKKCAVDKDFLIKNPRIDTRTDKWLQEFTYHREENKD